MRVLVVAPLDIDLVQGCGGYVSRLDREGHEVVGVNLRRLDQDATVAAAKACGYSNLELAQVRTEGSLPSSEDLAGWLSAQIGGIEPDIVISPWIRDRSSDHQLVAELLSTICVPWSVSSVRQVLMYRGAKPAPGFEANVRVRVREQDARRKRMAYEMFPAARFADYPGAWRSLQAQMEVAGCLVGVEYAEEFVLLWEKV